LEPESSYSELDSRFAAGVALISGRLSVVGDRLSVIGELVAAICKQKPG
jgi:hypothetical protein